MEVFVRLCGLLIGFGGRCLVTESGKLQCIDTHCHFDFDAFSSHRADILKSCNNLGISRLIVPGVSPEQWLRLPELCERYQGLYFSLGIHPWWIQEVLGAEAVVEIELRKLEPLLLSQVGHRKCVALGECGLDKSREQPLAEQLNVLRWHCRLALQLNKPLVLHCVKAHNEMLQCLNDFPNLRGVVHGFTGSVETASAYWQRGFYLGVGGSITYERARKTREAIRTMPLESLLLETDAPDMPLSGRQGQHNSPVRIIEVAQSLAELKSIGFARIAQATTTNAQTLFCLSD